MTKRVIVEVNTQPDIAKKYPNYRFNYSSPKEFIDSQIKCIEDKENANYGYEISVVSDSKIAVGDTVAFIDDVKLATHKNGIKELTKGMVLEILSTGELKVKSTQYDGDEAIRDISEVFRAQDLL